MRWFPAAKRAAAALLLPAAIPCATAAAPDIDAIAPLSIRPGVVTEIVFGGRGLEGARTLWTSFPARVEGVGDHRFKVLAESETGPGTVRALGTNGVSNPAFVMLDDLPTTAGPRTNTSRATAHPVTFGSAVDGQATELGYQWFKLRLTKGQRVALETVAARLGSKMDSVLRIEDASGREIARNDDAPGLGGDSHLNLAAPESGEYLVELRDVNYGGGSGFGYHLRIGDFPLVTTAFPPFARAGSLASFELAGPGHVSKRVKGSVPGSGSTRLALPGRAGSAFARFFASATNEVVEAEPNDSRPNLVNLGEGLNGRFDRPGDRDGFQFTAMKGDHVEFRAATRSLGSQCDAVLRLESAGGTRLASSNPSASDEGVLAYSFPSNGTYRLVVEEASGGAGAHLIYHVATLAPGLTLSLETEHVNAAPGKTFELKVNAARTEFKGAVTLSVESAGGPLKLANNLIAEGKTNTTVKVTVPESFASGSLHPLTVRGTARRDGKAVTARASTTTAWRKHLPLLLHPAPEFEGVLWLGVTGGQSD